MTLDPDKHPRDALLEAAGIGLEFPAESPRADRWLADTRRLTDLREKAEERALTPAEGAEFNALWRRVPPQPVPKLPNDYQTTMDRLFALKARLEQPGLSDTVYNRLSWNFADLINHLAGKVEAGEWIGDARLSSVLAPPVDGQRRRTLGSS
jgi:hypothetical protein